MANIPEIEVYKTPYAPEYTDDEVKFLSKIKRDCMDAYQQRESRFTELDDQTYTEFYMSNSKAANAYISPKLNADEIRTVSGTTREKCNALVSALLNYNLEADITAFDEDDMPVQEIGTLMEDMIKKSRYLETPVYDVKRPLIYQEFIDQGTCFVRERFVEHTVIRKKIKDMNVSDLTKIKWIETSEKLNAYCDAELLYGLNVFLGNIREFFIELQPYVITRRELSYAQAESEYLNYPRWENVPRRIFNVSPTTTAPTSPTYNNWSMVEMQNNMVEELFYYNKWTNTFQIILNGVMMLPIGFPLEFLTGKVEYPIAKGDLEPISRFFAYSRSTASKNKVNQALFDEAMRGIVLANRKMNTPPMANNTGQTLSRKIFSPSSITENIDPAKLQPIGNNIGVQPGQLQAAEFVKNIINESSVSSQFEGHDQKGNPTARQIVEQKQQQMMKLGMTILGIINLESKMAWLRLYNILANWTKPIDVDADDLTQKLQDTFRTISMDSEFEDGESGKTIIQMAPLDQHPHPNQILAQETLLSKSQNIKVKKVYLSPEELQKINYNWQITVTPTEKNTSELRAAIFMDSITQGFQLFGPQAFNQEYVKKVWANYQKLPSDKLFAQAAPPQDQQGSQPQPPQQTSLQSQMMPKQMQKPSLNTLISQ